MNYQNPTSNYYPSNNTLPITPNANRKRPPKLQAKSPQKSIIDVLPQFSLWQFVSN